jgi:single-strand DNA-binding protein
MLKLNKVFLAGRLVRDPDCKTTASGMHIASFTIAMDGYKKDAPAEFFQVTAFDKTAEFIQKYFTKGTAIMVEGRLKQQVWEKDGVKHSKVSVDATNVSFIEGKAASEHAKPQAASAPAASAPASSDAPDDLPF